MITQDMWFIGVFFAPKTLLYVAGAGISVYQGENRMIGFSLR